MSAARQADPTRSTLPWRRVAVAGLGRSGASAVRFLRRRGVAVAATDSRPAPPGLDGLEPDAGLELRLGALDPAVLAGAELVVASPGLDQRLPFFAEARRRGLPVVGDVELFARLAPAPVVAVTGSNGKSTVTALVAAMAGAAGLRAAAGANLGTPVLDLLEGPAPDLYVLELSSFQLELTASLAPQAAAVLNVSPDHLDRHADLAAYAAAKARILAGAATAVVNRDDPVAAAMPAPGRRVTFGLGAPGGGDYGLVEAGGRVWLCRGGERRLAADEVPLAGRHNLANVLAAMALADAAGIAPEAQRAAVSAFAGLPHRMVTVGERRGARWIDDSKATNVGAALAALEGLPGPLVWIAGGDAKGADLAPLRAAAAGRVRLAVLMGRDAPRLAETLAGAVPVVFAADVEEAVRLAAEAVRPGETVLLSPACASLDQYASFEERGRRFAAAVEALA
ncbi:UDP-N-acetylmuramoyl-L-alanine--D-glutamate ligase [Inmirania thermothiophila]|uniref:UDP-N-acetylmuramoylalanine--D-glutamate ligase n=1 Tax=Inmirania thermothiophila TaxID=1750597 RepID=A0A3N1XWV7_9GAMM|nr:UDP-N-acetylmuramoyl-L-alanine--D-glutamate ligase [Inmirania thermothiophila]ROR29682.1 UDP-N-acetylmuramoylalanine--D-glutamate ligase [Inmirania thermothiophila]